MPLFKLESREEFEKRFLKIKVTGVDGTFYLMNGIDNPDDKSENGPVCTYEQYASFTASWGHMYDGIILRFGEVVCGREGWHFIEDSQ